MASQFVNAIQDTGNAPAVRRLRFLFLLLTLLPLVAAACGMPRDPEETFNRVSGGVIRAGITENPPWVLVEGQHPSGVEIEIVQAFARRLDARIDWRTGSEGALVEALERGELDLIAGGVKDSTPWARHAGMTRPYASVGGDRYVMLVRQGENRWMLELDRFLRAHESDIDRRLRAAHRP